MTTPYLHAAETKLILQCKKDLETDEGFGEYAYADPLSRLYRTYHAVAWGTKPARELLPANAKLEEGEPWTYGFGFTHGVTPDSRISRIAAERMLEDLILKMDALLAQKLPWYTEASFVTRTILINMGFNMGVAGLLGFRNTLEFVKAKQYTQAARNMTLSLWYAQTGSRAKKLVKRMETQTIEPHDKAQESIQ